MGDLPVSWVDVIHRVVNDPGRLSERWFKEALSSGLLEDEFVEIIIVCVQAIAIDIFSSAIGINLVPLPKVEKG